MTNKVGTAKEPGNTDQRARGNPSYPTADKCSKTASLGRGLSAVEINFQTGIDHHSHYSSTVYGAAMNYEKHHCHLSDTGEAQPYLKPLAFARESQFASQVDQQESTTARGHPRAAIPPPQVLQSASSQLQQCSRRAPSDLVSAGGRTELAYLIVDLQDPTGTEQKETTASK